jgi:predicted CoA-binding protein
MPVESDAEIREVLSGERVAVVGASTTPGKDAHDVPAFLQDRGYEVVPVNPFADEVLGEQAYDSLADVPGHVDVVDVFRPSDEVAVVVDDAVEHDDVDAVWLQLGIHDADAVRRAETAGMRAVVNRCMRSEYKRLVA